MKYFRRVIPYLRPYRLLAVWSVTLIFVGSVVSLLKPWPMQILVDHVLPGTMLPGPLAYLPAWMQTRYMMLGLAVGASFLLAVLVHAVAVFDQFVNTKLDQRMALDFRTDLFEHAQKLSMAYHDQRRTGNLIFTINSQGEAVSRLIMIVPPLAQSAITLIGMVWICWTMDRQLTLIALSIAPLLYITTTYYMRHVHSRLIAVRNMEGEALSIVHEAVTMMRVIIAFGREKFEQQRFREQGERALTARVSLTVQQAVFSLIVATIMGGGTSLVLGMGFYHALEGQITIGQLLVILSYISMIYQPMSTISTTIGSLQEVFVNLQMAFELLDTQPDIQDAPGATDLTTVVGRVAFDNVSFSYQDRQQTLSGISFATEPGQVVAIVGRTGAGKTTLVSLIPRFYDAAEGSVSIDGQDVRSLTMRSLRQQISVVLQEPLLFSGPIAANIQYGRADATLDDIVAAARAANAHEFISNLPEGYNTMLGEKGAKLSGGERQRISIARAFLKNAPILILDEPTSSIDTRTERVILDALDRLIVGRTTFIIAHRLSTIRRADVVMVLDHGRIVEQGAPDELLQRNGPYRQLHDLQAAAAEWRASRPPKAPLVTAQVSEG